MNRSLIGLRILNVIVVLLCCLFFPKQIYATIQNSIEISPAFLDVDMSRLDYNGYPITITNRNKSALEVSTKYIPFTPAKNNDGTLDFHPDEESILSSFLPVSQDNFFISAGETKIVNIIPNETTKILSGDYYEALVFYFSPVSGGEKQNFKNTAINSALAVSMFVRTNPNAQAKYAVKPQNPPNLVAFKLPSEVNILLENMGNTYGVPRGEIELTDFTGRVLARGIINTDSKRYLPASGKSVSVLLNKGGYTYPLYLGTFSIRIKDAKTQDRAKIVYQKKFIGIDPLFVVGFILGTIVFVSTIAVYRYEKGVRHKYGKHGR